MYTDIVDILCVIRPKYILVYSRICRVYVIFVGQGERQYPESAVLSIGDRSSS